MSAAAAAAAKEAKDAAEAVEGSLPFDTILDETSELKGSVKWAPDTPQFSPCMFFDDASSTMSRPTGTHRRLRRLGPSWPSLCPSAESADAEASTAARSTSAGLGHACGATTA